jgi:hypothetical protein
MVVSLLQESRLQCDTGRHKRIEVYDLERQTMLVSFFICDRSSYNVERDYIHKVSIILHYNHQRESHKPCGPATPVT